MDQSKLLCFFRVLLLAVADRWTIVVMSPLTLWVPDYSSFHVGCKKCGKMISQAQDTNPTPCPYCSSVHYCVSKESLSFFIFG